MASTTDESALPVEDMLNRYRKLLSERGFDWGDEWASAAKILLRYVNFCSPDLLINQLDRALSKLAKPVPYKELTSYDVDPVAILTATLLDPLPPGIAVVCPDGIQIAHKLPYVLPGRSLVYHVFKAGDNTTESSVTEVSVGADNPSIHVNGHTVLAVETTEAGSIRLLSDDISRWSVLDERGGAWFPDGVPERYDWENRPYFYGNDLIVELPVGSAQVTIARGCEFKPSSRTVSVEADMETTVEISPDRLYDAVSHGWYGGDLHVHLNYSGDYVCAPHEAGLMQAGEGLHLMNLLAANCSTDLVYDREAFEYFVGQDLPWSDSTKVARWGCEYRNDLLGHFTVLNAQAPPTRYFTGHKRSNTPHDWPPNAISAAEAHNAGGTVTYTHPSVVGLADDDALATVFAQHRARVSDARELVADAALGLVDSIDLGSPSHVDGAEYLYHRLLGCGLRLAATAGTDAMLTQSRHWAHSNPPGWYRCYANIGASRLSVTSWQDALRQGKTFVTNGPWIHLDVSGHGIGDTISCDGPNTVTVTVTVTGTSVQTLEVHGSDGLLSSYNIPQGFEHTEFVTELTISGSTWIAAIARGATRHGLRGPQPIAYAHTSPVWIEINKRAVANPRDAAWCLEWLDRFESLARTSGNFRDHTQLAELIHVIERARPYYQQILDDSPRR